MNCIVEDCIKIMGKRPTDEVERFSNPQDALVLQHRINAEKRLERIQGMIPEHEVYLERYKPETWGIL